MTAIEWLANELPTINWNDPFYKDKLEQAKEIEELQIVNAYNEGSNDYKLICFYKYKLEQAKKKI